MTDATAHPAWPRGGVAAARQAFLGLALGMAAVTLLAPAAARVALFVGHAPLLQFLAFYACILGCVLVDTLYCRSGGTSSGDGARAPMLAANCPCGV